MSKKLVCAYCGKELQEESPDAEDISYVVDPDDWEVVCLECLHHNPSLHYPIVTFYPSGEKVWVSENFTGTNDFRVIWVPEHKYKGTWKITSETYERMDAKDVDSTIADLKRRGVEFALVDNNVDIEVWIKK
ncbi:MAG: hypothetical protein JW825_03210 [Candidatus Methanofastidiosa archaeon]|nr:hypothetical protein [Candidatus Methanofastidiosa archaeon]